MKKHIILFAPFIVCVALACSIFSPKQQSQPNKPSSTEAGEQNSSQPEFPIVLEIYEYKEGWSDDAAPIIKGDGWKQYHVKFYASANQSITNLGYLDQKSEGGGFSSYPYISTTDGHTYGNTTDTVFNIRVYAPPIGTLGFPGIPVSSYLSLYSGEYRAFGVDFSIPEKLTPQKLIFPFWKYSIDLPPLGTEKPLGISIQTNQIINFPGKIEVDSDIDIKVFDFAKTDPYITINFDVINKNIAKNTTGFSSAVLVDSFGLTTTQIEDQAHPECTGVLGSVVGPGQTKSGTLCFMKNSKSKPAFYILYFTTNRIAGPDNKAILIKP